MRESDTYLAIVEEGSIAEVRKLIVSLGKKWLGTPDPTIITALNGITDLENLERIHQRLGEVKTWQELLTTQ